MTTGQILLTLLTFLGENSPSAINLLSRMYQASNLNNTIAFRIKGSAVSELDQVRKSA